jgi:hypothetical protein
MGYLKGLRRVTEEELHRFIAGKTMPANFVPAAQAPRQAQRIQSARHTAVFDILRHVGKLRKVGRNYVTRCPSCAEAGHDRGGDNLAILIGDSRFYKCWAGCTKEMIRAAVGHPIRARRTA